MLLGSDQDLDPGNSSMLGGMPTGTLSTNTLETNYFEQIGIFLRS